MYSHNSPVRLPRQAFSATRTNGDVRRARVQAIADAATVRQHLGQEAYYQRTGDGRHIVSIFDRTAGRLRTWNANTVNSAIEAAQAGMEGPG